MNQQQKDTEQRSRIAERMRELQEYHSATYEYIRDQLEFASGHQWQDAVLSERERDGRPSLVLNLTKSYINRVVNPLRMNPVGIRIGTDNPDLTDLITGIIRQVEVNSRAQEAYETAYETSVTAGLGWIKIGTDYEDDESLEQKVVIDIVRNPLSVWLDPYSQRADGSDAEFGACVEYMDSRVAEKLYGKEATQSGDFSQIDIFDSWQVPADSVPDVAYYELESEEVTRYFYEDGSFVDDEPRADMPFVRKREIKKKQCRVVRYVGNKKIGEDVIIPIPYIPLVPVYGDHLYLENADNVHLGGLVHWIKDSQRMVNYYGSNELELASLAPKAPWVIAEGQLEGYEEIWAEANRKAVSNLPYKPTTIGGQAVPPPQRADNTAQTAPLMQSRAQAQADMGREIGIFDNMLGSAQGANETGKAVLMRASQAELPTAHYLQNLQQSIAQVGRVVMYLLAWTGDTERAVPVRDSKGQKVFVNMQLNEILTPKFLQHAEVEVTSGPAYESKRRESINAIMQLAQIMPDKMSAMADLLVRNMDAPGSQEIADRLEKLLPPELRDGVGEGPTKEELEAQLEQSQQMLAMNADRMKKLEGIIQQLQARILDNDKDRQADLAKAIIKEEGAMAREKMKQAGEDERALLKIEADAEGDMRKLLADITRKETDTALDVAKNFSPEDFVPSVEGPISVPTAQTELTMQENEQITGQ